MVLEPQCEHRYYCSSSVGVYLRLLKLNIKKKGTFTIMGLLGNLEGCQQGVRSDFLLRRRPFCVVSGLVPFTLEADCFDFSCYWSLCLASENEAQLILTGEAARGYAPAMVHLCQVMGLAISKFLVTRKAKLPSSSLLRRLLRAAQKARTFPVTCVHDNQKQCCH